MTPCPAPDPYPSPPRMRPPRGAVDCHAHVFGPFDRFPLASDAPYAPEPCTFEDYDALLRVLGVARAVIVQARPSGTDNRVTLDAVARASGRYRGIAVIGRDIEHRDLELLAQGGIRGVRLSSSATADGFTLQELPLAAAKVRPFGWHVQLHFSRSQQLLVLAPVIRALSTPVVLDHLASTTGAEGVNGEGFQRMLELLVACDHVWVKIASFYRRSMHAPPYDDMRPLVEAVVAARPDRVIWGSNWPHPVWSGVMPNDGDLLDTFMSWVPDAGTQNAIFVSNSEALFGFSPWVNGSAPPD